ncbi:hypothetical protein KKG31_06320 [Patescibacteria group bacterium]|nr:hypothetical protein [Patescibacteria group bacterium]MBU1758712.1 hypothetical protein [Patescibacteria group bacterium]
MENIDKLRNIFESYCEDCITDEDIIKSVSVDTKIYDHEWNLETLADLEKLAPFGEGNQEPTFLLEDVVVDKIETV